MKQASELNTYFTETQRMKFWWAWLLILITAAIAWWTFIQGIVLGQPVGDNPPSQAVYWLILAFAGIGLPLLLYVVKMTTTVTREKIVIRYWPFVTKRIPVGEIKSFAACQYRPIREYGGWGIRWAGKRGMAYSMSGKEGVQLELNNGHKILVGSQQATQLETALRRAQSEQPR
jgi:hypothetical protein